MSDEGLERTGWLLVAATGLVITLGIPQPRLAGIALLFMAFLRLVLWAIDRKAKQHLSELTAGMDKYHD